jgi:hypothetical protein
MYKNVDYAITFEVSVPFCLVRNVRKCDTMRYKHVDYAITFEVSHNIDDPYRNIHPPPPQPMRGEGMGWGGGGWILR